MPRQLSLLLVATQFLTRLPVPAMPAFQPIWLTRSARYFPLVGALVGAITVGFWWLCQHWLPAAVSIGLMMAASLLLTGALHEDGFADSCDGLGGAETSERALAIMKDSRIGAYGVLGIVMMLGLKWVTLLALPATLLPSLVIGSQAMSRWSAIGLIWRLRYVRADSDGKSKPLADSLSGLDWLISGLIGAAALVPAVLASGSPSSTGALPALAAAIGASLIAAAIAGRYFKQRLGGYTGDCLGAAQQLSELAFLLAALALLSARQPPV